MFCPTCGREESHERKFCIACGTNLERVTKAISPSGDSPLVRADRAFDRLLARYAGMFFRDAPDKAEERSLGHSWLLLGQSFLSLLANIVLLGLMGYVLLPVRFVILLFSTAFRLLAERGQRSDTAELPPPRWSADAIMPSVTDPATIKMPDPAAARQPKLPH